MDNYTKNFKKSLKGFLKRAPLLIEFEIKGDILNISEVLETGGLKFLFNFRLNFNKDIKNTIHSVKMKLLEFYPILTDNETIERNYTAEELNHLVEIGDLSIEDDLSELKKIITNNIEWRIEKILVMKDEVIIRSLDTNILYRYRMTVPVTVFLRNLRTFRGEDKEIRFYNLFKEKAELIEEVIEGSL